MQITHSCQQIKRQDSEIIFAGQWIQSVKIWNSSQCQYLNYKRNSTLEDCKNLCSNTSGCNAIAHGPPCGYWWGQPESYVCGLHQCPNPMPELSDDPTYNLLDRIKYKCILPTCQPTCTSTPYYFKDCQSNKNTKPSKIQ